MNFVIKIITMSIAFFASSHIFCAMQATAKIQCKIDQVPEFYTQSIAQLRAQALFDGTGSYMGKSKILQLTSLEDCGIFRILCNNVTKILGRNSEQLIRYIDPKYDSLRTSNGEHILHGIEVCICDAKESATEYDFQILTTTCQTILTTLKNGWTQSEVPQLTNNWTQPNDSKYPNTLIFEKPAKDWIFLIKEQAFIEEDGLINCLGGKFQLQGKIDCYTMWQRPVNGWNTPEETKRMMYLWIKRTAYDEVVDAFKFIIAQQT